MSRQKPPSRRTGAGARINADNIHVYRAIVVLVIAAGLSGVIMSWSGQLYVAAWFQLPPQLAWTVPVAFDIPVATLALASLAMKSRGREGTAFWFTVIALTFTVMSSAANFLYVSSHTHLVDYQAWTGAVGKAVAPFITLVMTEVLGALVTRPAGERGLLAKRTAELKATRAELAKLRRAKPVQRVEANRGESIKDALAKQRPDWVGISPQPGTPNTTSQAYALEQVS